MTTFTIVAMLLGGLAYAGPITQKPLDEFVIYNVPGTTTLSPRHVHGANHRRR